MKSRLREIVSRAIDISIVIVKMRKMKVLIHHITIMAASVSVAATALKILISLSPQAISSADRQQNLTKIKRIATLDQVESENSARTIRNHHNHRHILSPSEETAASQIDTKIALIFTSANTCKLLPTRKAVKIAIETQNS